MFERIAVNTARDSEIGLVVTRLDRFTVRVVSGDASIDLPAEPLVPPGSVAVHVDGWGTSSTSPLGLPWPELEGRIAEGLRTLGCSVETVRPDGTARRWE